jgi:hypothetical protein
LRTHETLRFQKVDQTSTVNCARTVSEALQFRPDPIFIGVGVQNARNQQCAVYCAAFGTGKFAELWCQGKFVHDAAILASSAAG